MKAYSSERFVLPLPTGHRFPMTKYARLRRRVEAELPEVELLEPLPASEDELALAHDREYIERVVSGNLSPREQREIGFPWSDQMVERSRRSVGATLGACRAALAGGVAVNLAGGTHHAMRDKGQGFCVFNDSAIAARAIQAQYQTEPGRTLPIAIVDLDVHQGNGTASILAGDESVFTLSIHCESNFPFRKSQSCLDVGLPEGTGDQEYLEALEHAIAGMLAAFTPELILYLAGADPHVGDRLGRLCLSTEALLCRDRRVFHLAQSLQVPLAVAMAGGYGVDIDETVAVHFNTVSAACDHWRHCRASRISPGLPTEGGRWEAIA